MIDHVLLGGPDLESSIEWMKQKTKLIAQIGGIHPKWNTHNALLSLGSSSYLELIAPQPGLSAAKPFEILSTLSHPKIFTWAARTPDINFLAEQMSFLGIAHSGIVAGARLKENGSMLSWSMLFPEFNFGGIFPFFIQWTEESIHPSQSSPEGLQLIDFMLFHPEAEKINHLFHSLGLGISCSIDLEIKLNLKVNTPRGIVML